MREGERHKSSIPYTVFTGHSSFIVEYGSFRNLVETPIFVKQLWCQCQGSTEKEGILQKIILVC